MPTEKFIRAMHYSRVDAAISWLGGTVLLIIGTYQLLGTPGLFVGIGSAVLARAIAQENRSALYPIGLVAIDQLDENLHAK